MSQPKEDEHIAKHYIAEDYEPQNVNVPVKRHKSKFPGNLPPSCSTFNNKTTAHNGVSSDLKNM